MTKKTKLGIPPSPAAINEQFQIAAQKLQERLEDAGKQSATGDPDEVSAGPVDFTPRKIVANKGPTLEFDGKLLIEYSTDPQGKKTRWTEFRLWETPKGSWVMETVGRSNEVGEASIVDAEVFHQRPIEVMDWLGWSYPARAIAKKMGWNLIVRVE